MTIDTKSLTTNLIAAVIVLIGYGVPKYGPLITTAGFFALSGALTNWLAIYMLFERVPFLYGSGVIPLHFEDFKRGIQKLIMTQFFTPKSIQRFFGSDFIQQDLQNPIDHLINSIDFDQIFRGLAQTILESKFGSVLSMVGGAKALHPLKDPMIEKLHQLIHEVVESDRFKQACITETASTDVHQKIEHMVEERLNELTPNMVKNIIQDMIRKHLGWLVVWGGIFGGLIGIVLEVIKLIHP
jgi:uncharacterized membrane protein YheB (UPF0754 family)